MRAWNSTAQALLAAAEAGTARVELVQLLQIDFTVTQRFAIAGHDKTWGGYTWTGLDIAVDAVEAAVDSREGLRFTFPGVTSSELALALGGDVEGSAVRLYVAVCDPTNGSVADAQLFWSGQLDIPGWSDGNEAFVHFTAEHSADEAARPKPIRYTNDAQQRLYPGDTFFNYAVPTDAAPIVWPAASFFKK